MSQLQTLWPPEQLQVIRLKLDMLFSDLHTCYMFHLSRNPFTGRHTVSQKCLSLNECLLGRSFELRALPRIPLSHDRDIISSYTAVIGSWAVIRVAPLVNLNRSRLGWSGIVVGAERVTERDRRVAVMRGSEIVIS